MFWLFAIFCLHKVLFREVELLGVFDVHNLNLRLGPHSSPITVVELITDTGDIHVSQIIIDCCIIIDFRLKSISRCVTWALFQKTQRNWNARTRVLCACAWRLRRGCSCARHTFSPRTPVGVFVFSFFFFHSFIFSYSFFLSEERRRRHVLATWRAALSTSARTREQLRKRWGESRREPLFGTRLGRQKMEGKEQVFGNVWNVLFWEHLGPRKWNETMG